MFTEVNLDQMCPKLITEYCFNFSKKDNDVCSIWCLEYKLLSVKVLGGWLKVLIDGFGTYYLNSSEVDVEGHGSEEILRNVGGDGLKNTIDHNSLTPSQRLLFNVVWRSLVPHSQKRSTFMSFRCHLHLLYWKPNPYKLS